MEGVWSSLWLLYSWRDYHYAIVKTSKNKEKIIKENVARSLSCGNPKIFWSQIQKINKSKNFSVDEIDGKRGVDACNIFKEKYKSLYNENSSCLDNILSECNVAINKECSTKLNNNPNHLHQITISMVKNAVSNLKRGKTDILNNIFSDSFIEAPTILYEFLANIYTIIIKHGIWNL